MLSTSKNSRPLFITALSSAFLFLASCQKDLSSSGTSIEVASSTIAVASSQIEATSIGGTSDSVFIVQPCARGHQRKAIAQADLPAAISTYLAANYDGYVFNKAFAVVNSSGATTAYVAVIFFNDKPVGILFDSTGNFVKVLEQREKGDLDGKGWHDGGRFCDRNGLQKDSVALNALPTSVSGYLSANYPQDTLVKAFKNKHDSSLVVLSKNNGLFATVFDANGNFKKRISLPVPPGIIIIVTQSELPSTILEYLNTTYPNYVFQKAFAVYKNNVLLGYVVVINSNNTKYGVRFDASGNFVAVKAIW